MDPVNLRTLIIIPVFNEQGVIGNVVEQIRATELACDCQILVIDDGSTDRSAEEARSAGARVISLIRNLGYGYALRTGYQVAYDEGFDLVVQMDGDGQHSAESIPALMAPVLTGQCDVVIGSRSLSDVHYSMPWARRQGQRFFQLDTSQNEWCAFARCNQRLSGTGP